MCRKARWKTALGSRVIQIEAADDHTVDARLHLLRRDGTIRTWYLRIKRRRGSKIARVAVMRRTATIMWRMLSTGEPWRPGKASSEKTSVAGDGGQTNSPRGKSSGPMAGGSEPGGSSTGSSSLLAGEEVAPCPA
jgi:hypothetical protein